jgi:hypothetical protein
MRVSVNVLWVTFDVTWGEFGNVLGNVISKRLKDAAVKVFRHTQLPFDSYFMQLSGKERGAARFLRSVEWVKRVSNLYPVS